MNLIVFADYFNENIDCISYPFQNSMYIFFSIDDILNNEDEIRFFGMKINEILFTGYYKYSKDIFSIYFYKKFDLKDFSELINIQTPFVRIFNIIKNLSNLFFKHISLNFVQENKQDKLIELYISVKYKKYKIFGTDKLIE
jgi:hypothetical protein